MSTSEVFSAPPSISSACPVIVPANLLALHPPRSATIISFAKPSSISANQVPSRWLSTRSQPRTNMRWPMWPSRSAGPATASRSSTRTKRTLDRRLRVAQVFSTSSRNLALIMWAFFLDRMPVAWLATTRTGSLWCRSCGLLRALLGDYDGLYDPTRDFNDRLLLGLKGIMSEAELHFLDLRMHEGRLNKARRGELFNHAPIGYVREPGGGLALDPDEQAQQVVRMVFDQFDRGAACMDCYATWSITLSACRFGLTTGRIGTGVASSQSRDTPKYVTSSALCRLLPSRPPRSQTPSEGARPARDRADN